MSNRQAINSCLCCNFQVPDFDLDDVFVEEPEFYPWANGAAHPQGYMPCLEVE